jgi:hypothetical protein
MVTASGGQREGWKSSARRCRLRGRSPTSAGEPATAGPGPCTGAIGCTCSAVSFRRYSRDRDLPARVQIRDRPRAVSRRGGIGPKQDYPTAQRLRHARVPRRARRARLPRGGVGGPVGDHREPGRAARGGRRGLVSRRGHRVAVSPGSGRGRAGQLRHRRQRADAGAADGAAHRGAASPRRGHPGRGGRPSAAADRSGRHQGR